MLSNESYHNESKNHFSHIYIEKNVFDMPLAQNIIKRYKNSNIIEIEHYKDVFCRPRQNYSMQKKSQNIILSKKDKSKIIQRGSENCHNFGFNDFYYISLVQNCLYDCQYCYLGGMFPSANIVIFLNIDDYFEIVAEFFKNKKAFLCISYDTDLLVFENLLGYVKKWIEFAHNNPNITFELRTKSNCFFCIKDCVPSENFIIAWTLSPQPVIDMYENKTPSLKQRVASIKQAIDKNWTVRISIDPIMLIDDFENVYSEFVNYVFEELDGDSIKDISIGTFRMGTEYFKQAKKQRTDSSLFYQSFSIVDGNYTYKTEISNYITQFVHKKIAESTDTHIESLQFVPK